MPLDGFFLRLLAREIRENALDSRVDRIHQPSREELILSLRGRQGTQKLLLSANADSPRIHLTQVPVENPKNPPMLCMLLRKHLSGARLTGVEQVGLDRILSLRFETKNELGDLIELSLIIEIMGRHSNIILTDAAGRILDAVKRITLDMSSVRQILPGMTYTLPPRQDKLNILTTAPADLWDRLRQGKDQPLSKALLGQLEGASSLVTREISFLAAKEQDPLVSALTPDQTDRLLFHLGRLRETVGEAAGRPTMLCDTAMLPKDFSFLEIHQYGASRITKSFASLSELLDRFYSERALSHRMHHRSNDLLKLLSNTSDRIARKLALQRQERLECEDRETLRIYGDLLQANLYRLEKGQAEVTLENFYDPSLSPVTIPLDPRLTPVQNAQKYYTEYRKADTALRCLAELIAKGEGELNYLDTVFDELSRASTEGELQAIREELAGEGYLRLQRQKQKPEKLSPKRFISSDGFTILVGRNNLQNDRLTLKDAHNYDIWFHTKNIPGSHTVVVADRREVPDSTLEEAAILAATHSKASSSAQVPVDYTLIKYVKKPAGARPGFVIYENYRTAYVTPDKELAERLAAR